MVSDSLFEAYPPFPVDTPVASLAKISLTKLFSQDVEESKAMFECCRTTGFFLLHLSGNEVGEALIRDLDSLLDLTKQIMNLPIAEKMKYHAKPPERLFGYKSLGFMKTETNQPDRCEMFMIGQDEVNGLAPMPEYPTPIVERLPLVKSYLGHAQDILHVVCRIMSMSLRLPISTISSKQLPENRSGTLIRLIKYPAVASESDRRTSLLPHTDMGTITLLANVLGGLQILPPSVDGNETPQWLYVKPEPNCLVVNMGDAMVQWTAGVLRSNMHRVTFPPGPQAPYDRYSVAFLVRATADADMRSLKGGIIPDAAGGDFDNEDDNITASEWEKKKNMALIQGKDCVRSTGGVPLEGI
ncbi:oxidoreductase [Lophiostoma macrostomum CBS 122681]|uniref:Oxidoreductase n=1 Tax=Lophiostoma macrostomum CBS 122681 TaxID=1314788 RepID=A0A6A6TBB6_9PLEO|nr:oxidoreductase [Lophiostoma macrostomum CBS 122681]